MTACTTPAERRQLLGHFVALCQTLAYAHARGVVHRDVKPENVFLATAQSSTAAIDVKVLDFGIAKVAAHALGAGTGAMGTPLWMAPEQTERQARVSPAADVWALALLVFWALVGKSYWRTAQSGVGSVPQLMREVLFEEMVPASVRAAELAPGLTLPAGFDAWFARATAREPSARYLDASAAGLDLFNNVLGASASITAVSGVAPPIHAPTPSVGPSVPVSSRALVTGPPVTAGRRAGSGKLAIVIGAGLVLLVLGGAGLVGLGGVLWFGVSERSQEVASGEPESRPEPPQPTVEPTPGAEPELPTPGAGPAPRVTSRGAATSGRGALPPDRSAAPVEVPRAAAYTAGQKVDVSWGGSWWQGQVLSVKDDKYLVHYIGWGSNWDEWVTTARLRPWSGSARSK
jgi:hypothetical protein